MILEGRVIRSQSRLFTVETSQGPVRAVVLKGLRSRTPELVDPVAVGDNVTVRLGAGTGATIEEVLPRRNRLSRPVVGGSAREQLIAANLGGALIVQAVSPPWKPATWDRYLVMAGAGQVPAALCLNKIDLDPADAERPELEEYRRLGIPVFPVSARSLEGIEPLREHLRRGPTVLIGPSGVGKSSLVNAIAPGSSLRTGALSRSTGKGRHTTTWVELVQLGEGIEVVDSPGLRVLGLWGVEAEDLARHFPEMVAVEGACRFNRCTHLHEPGCRIRAALESGAISPGRYDSYVRIRESLSEGEPLNKGLRSRPSSGGSNPGKARRPSARARR